MDGNHYMVFLVALLPIIIGFLWYHPALLGKAWMQSAKLVEADLKKGKMALILGLSYLLSVFLAFALNFLVHHEMMILATIIHDPEIGVGADAELGRMTLEFAEVIKARYSTFGHGASHGMFYCILIVLPTLGMNALFERRGGRYIFIHFGYWVLTMALMGGLLCQFF